jgi:hypothetical protein
MYCGEKTSGISGEKRVGGRGDRIYQGSVTLGSESPRTEAARGRSAMPQASGTGAEWTNHASRAQLLGGADFRKGRANQDCDPRSGSLVPSFLRRTTSEGKNVRGAYAPLERPHRPHHQWAYRDRRPATLLEDKRPGSWRHSFASPDLNLEIGSWSVSSRKTRLRHTVSGWGTESNPTTIGSLKPRKAACR